MGALTGRITAAPYVETRVIADAAGLASQDQSQRRRAVRRVALALRGGPRSSRCQSRRRRVVRERHPGRFIDSAVRGVVVAIVPPAYSGGARGSSGIPIASRRSPAARSNSRSPRMRRRSRSSR
jgi:hypothetical protein